MEKGGIEVATPSKKRNNRTDTRVQKTMKRFSFFFFLKKNKSIMIFFISFRDSAICRKESLLKTQQNVVKTTEFCFPLHK